MEMLDLINNTVNKSSYNNDAFLKYEAIEAQQKIQRVLSWIEANPSAGLRLREMVTKFNLAWSFEKDCGNGLCLVGFYTDESLNHKIAEIHDLSSNWFRG